jgi:hypothetical protein
MIKLAITLTTYEKPNGTTPELLKRALLSIKNQTFTNWKLFVVGDKFENQTLLEEIVYSVIDKEKVVLINNLEAVERDKYLGKNDKALWNCGGANARNIGNYYAVMQGFKWICALDHDDYWANNHLECIYDVIRQKKDAVFVFTLSTYKDMPYFPPHEPSGDIIRCVPAYAKLIHSSVCQNYEYLPLMYRDMFAEEGIYYPSDGDMWDRVGQICVKEKFGSYLIKEVTCFHETEGV